MENKKQQENKGMRKGGHSTQDVSSSYSSHHDHHQNSSMSSNDIQRQRSFVHPVHNMHPQVREPHPHTNRRRNSGMPGNGRGGGGAKPALEIYRPPTLRGPTCFYDPNVPPDPYYNQKYNNQHHNPETSYANQHFIYNQQNHATNNPTSYNRHPNSNHNSHPGNSKQRSTLNIHAKEFVGTELQHSKSGHNLRSSMASSNPGYGNSPPSPRVHFSDEKENNEYGSKNHRPPNLTIGPTIGVKRSKSLGCGDYKDFLHGATVTTHNSAVAESGATNRLVADTTNRLVGGVNSPMPDVGPFNQELTIIITKAYNEPSALSGRHLMEVSRQLMSRVLESSRYAEPMARMCITIIEKEKDETFIESLLNSCQEHFQERDRLLRNSTQTTTHGGGYTPPHPKWIAYMSFLNEMYMQLKRRHVQLMTQRTRNSETAPGLLLLTLLGQCCSVCLKEPSVNSLQEMECLFFVLTAIGKDIESQLPHIMCRVMAAARDAFIITVKVASVRKTLLQLIEMHAAGWNMPAPAVMYYYPGSSGSK